MRFGWLVNLAILLNCWSPQTWALTELDDRELSPDEILVTKDLIGYRPGDAGLFAVDEQRHLAGVPYAAFITSFDSLPLMDAKDEQERGRRVTPGKAYAQLYITRDPYAEVKHYKAEIEAAGYVGGDLWMGPKERVGQIDAALVPSLVLSDVFGTDPIRYTVAANDPQKTLLVPGDYDSIKTLKATYSALELAGAEAGTARGILVANAYAALNSRPLLRKGVEVKAGRITFGTPLLYPVAAKHPSIPTEWRKKYTVHQIQLALTVHELVKENITELTFLVYAPQDCIAAELAPLKVEREEETTKTRQTPDVEVGVKGASVKIGSFLGEEVSFKALIPTLIAYGLQEKDFDPASIPRTPLQAAMRLDSTSTGVL